MIKDITESIQIAQDEEEEEESATGTPKASEDVDTKISQLTITDGSQPAPAPTTNAAEPTKDSTSASSSAKTTEKASTAGSGEVTHDHKSKEKKSALKISDKQKEEMKKMIKKREEEREKRVSDLVEKLEHRLEIWTGSDKKEGAKKFFVDSNTKLAEDLKMESFGIELLHAIGYTYYTKGSNYLKSQKLLGVGGVFGKFKEKYTVVKDTWNTISSAIDAQYTIQDMAKYEEQENTFTDAEKAEKEREIMGKILNAAWNGSRFEIQSVLREVCDKVLNDKKINSKERADRAHGLVIIGDIFRKTVRSKAEQEEVQIFEELVQEAATSKNKKKKKEQKHKQQEAAAAAAAAHST